MKFILQYRGVFVGSKDIQPLLQSLRSASKKKQAEKVNL